ncbi:MAG: squalene synthase HpnD [Thermoleophilia bacterium]|nr:squalene synthase HpnD [Thermoleophilia bacterium]
MSVDQAYDVCTEVTRTEARNFYFGFILLPRERRRAIHALYAFSRLCDDSVDGVDDPTAKAQAVRARRDDVTRVYSGDGASTDDDPILIALADAIRRFGIPRAPMDALVDGVEMDLDTDRYADWPALTTYCDRVAGAVGVLSLYVFGFRDPAAPEHAQDLGVAMQVVNIMRDVQEDADRGRIYLPAQDMASHGVDVADILAGRMSDRMAALMHEQGDRAHEYFRRGAMLLPLLDLRARMCVQMLAALYGDILTRIEERGYDYTQGRVSLSGRRKAALMIGSIGRALLTRHR